MFKTTLKSMQGAKTKTNVYIVGGTRPEPLLGATDAENLGIITFKPEGRPATSSERAQSPRKADINKIETKAKCITAKLRQAGIPVSSEKADDQKGQKHNRQEALAIVKNMKDKS